MKRNKIKAKRHTGAMQPQNIPGIYTGIYGETPVWAKHFWPCFEGTLGGNISPAMYDVIGGIDVPPAPPGISITTLPIDDLYHIRQDAGFKTVTKSFDAFNGTDWLIMVAATSIDNGAFEFSIGGVTSSLWLKLQPYYLAISNGGTGAQNHLHTPFDYTMVTRTAGTDYVVAGVYRNNQIEHWVNGTERGSRDRELLLDAVGKRYEDEALEIYNGLAALQPQPSVRVGHSGTGNIKKNSVIPDPDTEYTYYNYEDAGTTYQVPASFPSGIVNETTQYAGALVASWPKGTMPADIGSFMDWAKTEWFAGNKSLDYSF